MGKDLNRFKHTLFAQLSDGNIAGFQARGGDRMIGIGAGRWLAGEKIARGSATIEPIWLNVGDDRHLEDI